MLIQGLGDETALSNKHRNHLFAKACNKCADRDDKIDKIMNEIQVIKRCLLQKEKKNHRKKSKRLR